MLLRGQLDRRGFRVAEHELLGRQDESLEVEARFAAPPRSSPAARHPHHRAGAAFTRRPRSSRPQRLREWAWQAAGLAGDAIEPLPADAARPPRPLPGAADALRAVHFPADIDEVEGARRRLAFEELFLYQAALATRRSRRRSARDGLSWAGGGAGARWIASLPFELDRRPAPGAG